MGGGSKSQTIGYRYNLGQHLVLTHGPVDALLRLQWDKKDGWVGVQSTPGTIAVDAQQLFGGEKREGGVWGLVDFLPGGPTQTQNPYLQQQLGSPLPAFRGVTSLVLRGSTSPGPVTDSLMGFYTAALLSKYAASGFYVGMNPYLKLINARLQRIHVRQDGLTQWYDAKAAIGRAIGIPSSNTWRYKVVPYADTTDYSSPGLDDSAWNVGPSPFANNYNANAAAAGFSGDPGTVIALENRVWLRTRIYLASLPDNFLFDSFVDNGIVAYVNGTQVLSHTTSIGAAYTDTIPGSYFVVGWNDLAIQGFDDLNGAPTGDAFYFDVRLHNDDAIFSDMNPSHIIRECLTDPDWGMGYLEADIDDASFTTAADTLYNEGMGISILWDRQMPIEDFIKEIVRHINATVYVSRDTGLFVLKLIRKDYVEADLLTLGVDDIEKVEGFSYPAFGELVNSVSVNFWDADTNTTGSYTENDTALIQQQGCVINTTIQYPGFTNLTLAKRVALRDLQTLSTPLRSATVTATTVAADLNIGDVYKLDWPDFSPVPIVMRIAGMALGDGKNNRVRLTCVQDAFSMPDSASVGDAQPPAWTDPSSPPAVMTYRIAVEAPYYELVQRQGQASVDSALSSLNTAGYVLATGGKPNSASINATMRTDSGAGYEDADIVDFCPVAQLTMGVDKFTNVWQITEISDLARLEVGTHFQCGNELCVVIEKGTTYIGVGRAVLDTVPEAHAAGAILYFWDAYAGGDPTQYVSGETVNVKLLPATSLGVLPEVSAPVDSVTLAGRAWKPYVPGKFQVNSTYWPATAAATDVAVSWAHRDRKQQTSGNLVTFTDGNVGPESGVTYTLRIYGENNTLIHTESGLTSTSYTYTSATEQSDSLLPGGTAGFQTVAAGLSPAVTAYYKMDETSGTVMTDSAAGANHGTYNSGFTLGQTALINGGSSVAFVGGYATLPNVAALAAGTGEYSITCRLKWTGTGLGMVYGRFNPADPFAGPTVFSNCLDDNNVAGRIQLRDQKAASAGYRVSSNATGLNDGIARTYTFQRKQTSPGVWKLQIYINGTFDSEATLTTVLNQNYSDVTYVMGRPGQQNVTGTIDELIWCQRALTAAEINDLHAGVTGGGGGYRLNGKLRFELEATRSGVTSFQKQTHTVKRTGAGFNYGEDYGDFVGYGNSYGSSFGG